MEAGRCGPCVTCCLHFGVAAFRNGSAHTATEKADRARARRRAAARAESDRRAAIRSVCAQILDREIAVGGGALDARKVLAEVRRWYRVQPRPAPAGGAPPAVPAESDRAPPARPRPPGPPPPRQPPQGHWPRDESSPPARPAHRKGPSVTRDIEAGRRRLLRSVGVEVRARLAAAPGPAPAAPALFRGSDIDALFRALG